MVLGCFLRMFPARAGVILDDILGSKVLDDIPCASGVFIIFGYEIPTRAAVFAALF